MILFPASPTGALTDTQISLDGMLQQVALDGVTWTVQSMDGWRLGAGVSTSFADRPSAHGAFDGPAYRRARIVTMAGTALADSRLLAEQAAETLAACMADGTMGTIGVSSPVGLRWVKARLSDTPQADMMSPVAFKWTLQFTAPDYRKYGDEQTVTGALPGGGTGLSWPIGGTFDFGVLGSLGQVTLENPGTAPTEPVLTITGPLASGFQVTQVETGRRLRYPSSVGDALVIDNGEGTATTGGQDRTAILTVREWFTIPAGGTSTLQFSSLGSETFSDPARMTAAFSPAYY